MNTDREVDQIIESWMEDRTGGPRQDALPNVLEEVHATPQQRRRWPLGGRALGANGDRGNRGLLAVAGMAVVLAMLAVGASVLVIRGPSNTEPAPAAGAGNTLVVAQQGGDHETISQALEAAVDGDTILVRPGTYTDALSITKAVTIAGDGPREQIILEATVESFVDQETGLEEPWVHGPRFENADAVLRDLTIVGADTGDGVMLDDGIVISGGSPTVTSVTVVHPDASDAETGTSLWATSGSGVRVQDNTFGGHVHIEGGSPSIIGNSVAQGILLLCPSAPGTESVPACTADDRPVVRDNTVRGIFVNPGGSPRIEGNVIEGPSVDWGLSVPNSGILVWGGAMGTGMTPAIVGNRITGHDIGIEVFGDAEPTIEDNQVADNRTGILIEGADPVLLRNSVSRSATGLVIEGGARPLVEGNRIESNDLGVSVARFAEPEFSGNVICENVTNIKVLGGTTPSLDGNEVCAEQASG